MPINQTPTEAQEQCYLFRWMAYNRMKYPELALCFHIPNGGSRHRLEAVHLKEQGVKAGVPDLCLPVARGRYHGLYIELKRQKGGRLSVAQAEWLRALQAQGYRTAVCAGWESARDTIMEYLRT